MKRVQFLNQSHLYTLTFDKMITITKFLGLLLLQERLKLASIFLNIQHLARKKILHTALLICSLDREMAYALMQSLRSSKHLGWILLTSAMAADQNQQLSGDRSGFLASPERSEPYKYLCSSVRRSSILQEIALLCWK